MSRKLRMGVIGLGMGKGHAKSFKEHAECELAALCDTDPKRLDACSRELGVTQTFSDAKAMFARAGLDAVCIATPNKFHAPLTIAALKAGLHVLCEKPMAMNTAEALAMKAAADKARRNLMINFSYRFSPMSYALKQQVESGVIGDIYFGRTVWHRRRGMPGFGGWFGTKALSGGGPLIDLAVHMLDLTMWFMGNPEPETVLASTYSVFGPKMEALGPWGTPNPKGTFDVEDMAVAMIRFANGATIALEASWASRCKREWVYSTLMGTAAGASLERVFEVDGEDDTAVDTLEVYAQRHGQPVNEQLLFPADPAMGRHTAVGHFVDCLLSGKQPLSPGGDGLRIMKILDAAYRSAQTGKAVAIR